MASYQTTRIRDTKSCLSSDNESEVGSDSEYEAYSDPDTDPDMVGNSDTEGIQLRQMIAFHKDQGRAKSKRSPWSNSLVASEFKHWEKYVDLHTPFLDCQC